MRPYVSKSSIETFELCQVKYFISYVLGYRDKQGKAALIGTMVHKFAEWIANATKNSKYDHVYGYDLGIWQNEVWEKNLKNNPDLNKEDYVKFNNLCNQLITKFDIRKCKIVDTELEFDLELPYEWAKLENGKQLRLKGIIDLIIEIEPHLYSVIDYKTGKRINFKTDKELSYADIAQDIQLSIYDYAMRKLYPGKSYIYNLFYVKDGDFFSVTFTEKNIKRIEDFVKQHKKKVEALDKLHPLSLDRSSWKCKYLCAFSKDDYWDSGKCACQFVQDSVKTTSLGFISNSLRKSDES